MSDTNHDLSVPIIDLADRRHQPTIEVIAAVADAAETFGFFQVVNHGIAAEEIDAVWQATRSFFALPLDVKRQILRTKENSRGYYDRELTKNARDLKEVLDLAQVPYPELADDDPKNFHSVDGYNQWPTFAGFRDTMVGYMQSCEKLALWLVAAFSQGLGEGSTSLHRHFGVEGGPEHTSFVRLNHYPVADLLSAGEAADVTPLGDMALHHHSDSGALTLLLQDDAGGLQVAHGSEWVDVEPIHGALVVNTGDMMQVWSNDRYQAPLHRVVPASKAGRPGTPRYSLPYFFNPSYATDYAPLPGSIRPGDTARYRSINWGEFRQARADGDFADYGAEVQITDFRM